MADIDFTQLKKLAEAEGGDSIEVLPAGKYNFVVKSAKVKAASTGSQMISLFLRVTDGPYKENGKLFTNIVFKLDSPKAVAMALSTLSALGVSHLLEGERPLEEIAEALVGATGTADVGIKQWNGEDRNEVKNIKASEGGTTAAPASPFGNLAATGTDGPGF